MKHCMDEVRKVPYKCCCFSAGSGSKADQNRSRRPFFQKKKSSVRKATATKRMSRNNLESCGKKRSHNFPKNPQRPQSHKLLHIVMQMHPLVHLQVLPEMLNSNRINTLGNSNRL